MLLQQERTLSIQQKLILQKQEYYEEKKNILKQLNYFYIPLISSKLLTEKITLVSRKY